MELTQIKLEVESLRKSLEKLLTTNAMFRRVALLPVNYYLIRNRRSSATELNFQLTFQLITEEKIYMPINNIVNWNPIK